jgi:hypothetical protein
MHGKIEMSEPDVLITPLPLRSAHRAERELWFHVTLDALNLALGRISGSRHEIDAAVRWLVTPNERVAGFDWVCSFLDVEVSPIRALVKRWTIDGDSPACRLLEPVRVAPREALGQS